MFFLNKMETITNKDISVFKQLFNIFSSSFHRESIDKGVLKGCAKSKNSVPGVAAATAASAALAMAALLKVHSGSKEHGSWDKNQ